MEDVFVISAVRTPIGKYGGGLASVPPCDLAAKVVREAVSRAGVDPAQVGQVVFGNVHPHREEGHVPVPGGGRQRRPAGRDAGADREPAVRQRDAGHRVRRSGDHAGRLRGRGGRRSRVDEPRPVLAARHALGPADERRRGHRRHGRGAHRPVRRLPHGRDRGERRGRLPRVPGGPGRAGRGEPPPGRGRAPRRATSRSRSCRSRSPAGRARSPSSTPTSTYGRTSAWRTWPSCGPRSRRTARSPRATRPASTTPPRPSCSRRNRS